MIKSEKMHINCHRFFSRKEYLLSTLLDLPWQIYYNEILLGFSNKRVWRFGDGAHFELSEDI